MPSSESDLELRAYKVHEPAPEALQTVMAALQSSELWNVFYAIRSRTKSVEKIREKVLRKRKDNPETKADYEPEDIRDVNRGGCEFTPLSGFNKGRYGGAMEDDRWKGSRAGRAGGVIAGKNL